MYQMITLFVSAIIPIINVINFEEFSIRVLSSVLAAIVALATGITQLEKYHENWILYRTTTEILKKEKFFYENSAGEYANLSEADRNKLLVERVESLVSAETSKYFTAYQTLKPGAEGVK